jgi:predicted Rossmann fold flavoprotein
MKNVVVVGGGPAGMMAARTAAKKGYNVTLLERRDRLGVKLSITGKGRCNITNAGEIEDIMEQVEGNKYFLYSAFYQYTNEQTIDYFESLGVPTKVERGQRVFPKSDRAMDVVEALIDDLRECGVEIYTKQRVTKIVTENSKIKAVEVDSGKKYNCDVLILATGGKSYPKTGSTGDGYKLAKSMGHNITDIYPSLVPLVSAEKWVRDLQGLSLRNITLSLKKGNKVVYKDLGEMIFTHFGISGPLVLSGSRKLLNAINSSKKKSFDDIFAEIDLKPALDESKLDQRLQRDFEKNNNKQFKNSINELLPKKMIDIIIKLSGIDPEKKVNQITREERQNLCKLLKHLKFKLDDFRPIEEAIVTAGGVNVDEINPSTMESKLIEGLYFAGELIDVDAYTGGYNLQIAFSTGHLAGESC